MPAYSSMKASDTYDSLYLAHFFVVVSRHLAFDATQLHTFYSSHLVSSLPRGQLHNNFTDSRSVT